MAEQPFIGTADAVPVAALETSLPAASPPPPKREWLDLDATHAEGSYTEVMALPGGVLVRATQAMSTRVDGVARMEEPVSVSVSVSASVSLAFVPGVVLLKGPKGLARIAPASPEPYTHRIWREILEPARKGAEDPTP